MRAWLKSLRFAPALLVPLLSILAGAVLFLLDPVPLQILRNAAFDQFQRWQPRSYQDVPVRIIDIDEESLRRLGQWPWPRTRVAELLSRLQEAGAASIAFDLVFAEADRSSPKAMLDVALLSPEVRRQIALLPDHDAVLASALARGRTVLGFPVARQGMPGSPPELKARYIKQGENPLPYLHAFSGAIAPLPVLAKSASGTGAIAVIPDGDGVVRRIPLVVRLGDALLPSLAAEALRVAQGTSNYVTLSLPESGLGLAGIRVGELALPTTPQGEVWIHYSAPVEKRYIPAWKVLAGEVPAAELAGHILLVGTSAQGLMDLRFSPQGGTLPGVEIHAQALEQLLTGEGLELPSWSGAVGILLILGGGLLVGGIALYLGITRSFPIFLGLMALLGAASWTLFSRHGVLLDVITPGLSLAMTYVLSSIVRHRSSERRQQWIKQAFSRYISPNLVAYLIKQPNALELGGRRQQCSFVFTDLTDFTSWIEKMDPAMAVSLINEYLDHMIAIAFAHEGTLDRIIGDAVVIMFSAPVPQVDHQMRALTCAMEMQRFSRQYADHLIAQGIEFGYTRIGVHSGEVIVGNFGGRTFFDYRALGDPVNTAARLESANKQFGTLVCVSAATLAGCPGWPARPVGRVVLKGKSQEVAVFEPLDPEQAAQPDLEYLAAFALLKDQAATALPAFERLAARCPADPLAAFHLSRLRAGQTGDLIVMNEK